MSERRQVGRLQKLPQRMPRVDSIPALNKKEKSFSQKVDEFIRANERKNRDLPVGVSNNAEYVLPSTHISKDAILRRASPDKAFLKRYTEPKYGEVPEKKKTQDNKNVIVIRTRKVVK